MVSQTLFSSLAVLGSDTAERVLHVLHGVTLSNGSPKKSCPIIQPRWDIGSSEAAATMPGVEAGSWRKDAAVCSRRGAARAGGIGGAGLEGRFMLQSCIGRLAFCPEADCTSGHPHGGVRGGSGSTSKSTFPSVHSSCHETRARSTSTSADSERIVRKNQKNSHTSVEREENRLPGTLSRPRVPPDGPPPRHARDSTCFF